MTVTAKAPTGRLSEALAFILNADEHDLDRIMEGVKFRRSALRRDIAASVSVGATVTLDGLSPKYLNGMTGTVSDIRGQRGTVMLDATSTQRLRREGYRRYVVAADAREFPLGGVPLATMHVQ